MAVAEVAAASAPATTLARAQARWEAAAGAAVAAVSRPRSERDGVVTVACDSATWAHELALLDAELRARLNEELGGARGRGPVRALRFVAAPPGATR